METYAHVSSTMSNPINSINLLFYFLPEGKKLAFVKWDAVEPLRFYYVVRGEGSPPGSLAFKTVQLGPTVDRSGDVLAAAAAEGDSSSAAADPAFVGVIDGKRVRVTPFGQMVVPPPISAFELCLTHSVKQVSRMNSQIPWRPH